MVASVRPGLGAPSCELRAPSNPLRSGAALALEARPRAHSTMSFIARTSRLLRGIMPVGMPEHIKKKLKDELTILEYELAHDIPKELKKAVAMGDLSENAEYHMAKQRQEYLKARIRQLGKRLADLSLINMSNIPKDKVGLGSTVRVYDSTKNEEMEYKLVTSEESDVTVGKISTTSPIGRSLLNKKVGDTAMVVSPNGNRELEILKMTTIHDEVEDEPKAAGQ
jgi:transcription elongation factor GreA